MAAVKLLFCLFCVAFIGRSRVSDRDLLVSIALREVGVRELTGRNDGVRVDEYQKAGGCGKGDPWCAAWVSWVYKEAGYSGPRTCWSPDLFPARRLVKEPEPGDVLGIYMESMGRIGHCGIVQRMRGDWCMSIEGNTNVAGSREGDGVYVRTRHRRSIRKFSNWKDK